MKIKNNIFYTILIISLVSIILIYYFNDSILSEISLGILSGNIVALIIIILEYQDEKKELLESYVFEVSSLSTTLKENLNLKYIVADFHNYLILNKDENIDKLNIDYLTNDTNIKEVKKSIENIQSLKQTDTTKLARLFNNYHSLTSISYKNDKVRNQLYNLYIYIKELIEYVNLMNFNSESSSYEYDFALEQDFLDILSLSKKIYNYEVKDGFMIADDNLSFTLDSKIVDIAKVYHGVEENSYTPIYTFFKEKI